MDAHKIAVVLFDKKHRPDCKPGRIRRFLCWALKVNCAVEVEGDHAVVTCLLCGTEGRVDARALLYAEAFIKSRMSRNASLEHLEEN